MPFYYDSTTGDLEYTSDDAKARRQDLITLLTSHNYPLAPEAAGQLFRALGPADRTQSPERARQHVRRVLRTLGLGDLSISDLVDVLDDGWKVVLEIE